MLFVYLRESKQTREHEQGEEQSEKEKQTPPEKGAQCRAPTWDPKIMN